MKIVSAGLLGLAVILAVLLGAQTLAWSWGPALLALALAVAAQLRWRPGEAGWLVSVPLGLTALWVWLRCAQSPVLDGALADALLMLAVVGGAWVASGFRANQSALRWLFGVIAIVALGNEIMAMIQWKYPEFMWPYSVRASGAPCGFFGHYNYYSNFTLGVSLMLLARLFYSRDPLALKGLFAVVFLLGCTTIVLAGSRGGPVALGVGVIFFLLTSGMVTWRKQSRWSGIILVATPLLLIVAAIGTWWMLKQAQESRHSGTGDNITRIVDNTPRLQWLELSMSIARESPVTGVGSRGFSWKYPRYWDPEEFGRANTYEEFTHNEIVQLTTEYGVVGLVLVLWTLGAAAWRGLAVLCLGSDVDEGDSDAIAVGILAAGAGMLFQSNVSFVFHLLPSTLLLGIMLGLAMPLRTEKAKTVRSIHGVRGLSGLVTMAPMLWIGVMSSLTLHKIWPVMYASPRLANTDPEAAIETLGDATHWWFGHRLHDEKARLARTYAVQFPQNSPEAQHWNRVAAESFSRALDDHPYHLGIYVNYANTLSAMGKYDEAEKAYLKATELQGGLESAFKAKIFHANHLYRVWYERWTSQRRAAEALHEFLRARELLDRAEQDLIWRHAEVKALRKKLDAVIEFLEGARVQPKAPGSTDKSE